MSAFLNSALHRSVKRCAIVVVLSHYGTSQKTLFKKMRWYSVPQGDTTIKLPSVTTVLDVTMPQSRRDTLVRAEMANPLNYALRREQALARGIAVDLWFKQCLKTGGILRSPIAVQKQCSRLLPLVRGILKVGEPTWTDEMVYSIPLGVAGTLDAIATLPGGLRTLLEIKSSAYTIWPEAIAEAQLQGGAYFLLWNRMHPEAQLDAIATYHVTPYMIHEQVTTGTKAIAKVVAAWSLRLKQFASRYSQMEL